ncbi:xanthine dehydrogenase family protein molybdopterin-binding subunit [Oceanidesulfovibrio marinus]|uniref:Xanthine dehydrogenase family protein molybdopterin-binding subunit n=1 Tax=Oceanidesulfovibrio marinus TaxID=370038 RepID=A0A6P1ZHZ8_9BACT|nr:xanthine dehydrogenase family protein molybdopterin-binding subunit [Oceanidesulfovibrio marinus]TVM32868.1 xanthine dehydrogenase family protein molybdopterin-binding subunit [Oceanidesulfovibrio marinus]
MSAKKATPLYYKATEPFPQAPPPGQAPAPWTKTNVVGKRKPRVDGYERISGAAIYPSDITLPDMLYAAPLASPHPNAVLKSLDVSEAETMDGVYAIITPTSPEADIQWAFNDMEVPLLDRKARYEGWIVGAVAADTPYKAFDAVRASKAEWEVLPFVSDGPDALKAGAPKVHPDGNVVQEETYERGDIAAGFSQADTVLELDLMTQTELQTPVELHGCVARWDGDELTIWESTQGVFEVQSTVAKVLGMPLSRVRVIGHYVGGGFGSKLRTSKYAILAALLAKRANRPVKFFHTREHTFLDMGTRPASYMHIKAGVKKDGTLTALEFSGIGESGAYPAGGASLLDWQVKDLYTCPNVKTKLTDTYVNAGPARPFRAPGYPQGNWAMEQMMDALSREIDMDPVDLRLKNIPLVSQARENQPEYTTTGLKECITKGAEVFGWQEARKRTASQPKEGHLRRGVGMAACNWFIGGGFPPATVVVKLFADGSVNLNMGASDIGTGTKTIMALVVAEELGVDYDLVQIENADTGTTQFTRPSGGSKTVPIESPTVRMACIKVKEQLMEMAAEELETTPDKLVFAGKSIHADGDSSKSVDVTALKRLSGQQVVIGVGHKTSVPQDKAIVPFGAQFCEVEVNTLTGELKLLRFVAAHESGRIMDRLTYDCQVVGGVAMGIGLGTTEMRVLDSNNTGKLCNKNWHDYKLPTALDMPPEIISEPIEMPDDQANITGAKGLGEPVTVPTASAIANAVFDAVGVRMLDTPINPTTLAAKIAGKA